MTATTTIFRVAFPEFSDLIRFPDAMAEYWLSIAGRWVDAGVWGEMADHASYLVLAHHLALAARSAAGASAGGLPGASAGVLTSKSAGGVSAGYDFASVAEEGAGFWNATTYGQQYYRMVRLYGAGPIQIGTDGGQVLSTAGYAGPIF